MENGHRNSGHFPINSMVDLSIAKCKRSPEGTIFWFSSPVGDFLFFFGYENYEIFGPSPMNHFLRSALSQNGTHRPRRLPFVACYRYMILHDDTLYIYVYIYVYIYICIIYIYISIIYIHIHHIYISIIWVCK